MTIKEALKKMQAVKTYMTSGNPIWSVTEIGEAFDMAIESLEQSERGMDEWCTDCKEYNQEKHCCPRYNRVIRETIEEVQKGQKKGKWIYVERKEPQYDIAGVRTWAVVYKCSECGFLHTVIENFGIYDYCPNCGTRMEVGG